MAHSKPSSLHNDVSPKVLEEAADWLTLLGSGEATTEDHQALAHWRSKSPMHQQAWQRAEAIMGDFRQASAPVARETLSRVDHSGRRQALKTLALLLLAAPVGWSGYRYLPWPQWQADLRTAKGEQQTHQLDDGSQLVLNTDTAVAINFSSQQRRIQLLAGEMRIITGADSAHNKRPFVVQTAEGQLTPLGTRFTVRQFDGHSQLAVFDGRVQIQPNHGSQSAIVNAGEQRLFSQSEIQPVHPASENRSLWNRACCWRRICPWVA